MVELVPDKDYPDFNMLGLLLGGRPYAAQYYTDRARIDEENQATHVRGKFAKDLVASPEMRAANENPYNRANQAALWAQYQQGPQSIADMGSDYHRLMISGTNQHESQILDDQLARARIRLTSDEQIRVEQTKREMDAKARQAQYDRLFGTDANGKNNLLAQAEKNGMYEQASGQKVPEGYDVQATEGGLKFVPAMGGKAHQEMVKDYDDVDQVDGLLDKMQRIAKEGGKDKAGWVTARQLLTLRYKDLEKTGTLDEGTLSFFDKMIPDRWTDVTNPLHGDMIQEQLRVLREKNTKSRTVLDSKWMLDPNQAPQNIRTDVIPDPTQAEIDAGKQLQADQAKEDAIKKANRASGNRNRTSRFGGDREAGVNPPVKSKGFEDSSLLNLFGL